MGFTVQEEVLKENSAKTLADSMKSEHLSEKKDFYSFLQKLNLQTEMGME